MVEPLCNGWWIGDYYEMSCFENSKTYVLYMISTCYVKYVMMVGHALIVKLYPFYYAYFL